MLAGAQRVAAMGEGSVLQNAVPRCSRKGGLEAARSSGSGAAAAVEVGSPHIAFHAANFRFELFIPARSSVFGSSDALAEQ